MATDVAVFGNAHVRSTTRADVAFLLLDGLRRPRREHPQEVVLCALGLGSDWTARPLAIRTAPNEDEHCWRLLLRDLKEQGIGDSLLLISCDGHPALLWAIRAVYPDAPVQVSVSHELLALARKVDRRWRAACMSEARQIFAAPDRATAIARYRNWRDQWLRQGERAVSSLEEDLASCLTFYRFPSTLWSKIRTVNLVERMFRQSRQSAFPVTSEAVRDQEDAVGVEQTLQAGTPPVKPETGGTPATALEQVVSEAHLDTPAEESLELPVRPIEQEIPPVSNGRHDLPADQGVDLSADADFMWWLRGQRRIQSRRVRILMALAMSFAGLVVGVILSRGM